MGLLRTDPVAIGGVIGLIAVVGQDVARVAVLAGADLQRQAAGRFHAWLAVTLDQRQQAQTGAVTVFGMPTLFQ